MRASHRRVQHATWNVRDDHLRLVLADHAHDVPPQLQVGREVAVLVAEELHALDAEHPGGRPLLPHPDGDQLRVLLLRVLPALPAVGDDDVGHLGAAVRQAGDRTSSAEIGIVGMSRDDHHALELGQPPVAASAGHGERL